MTWDRPVSCFVLRRSDAGIVLPGRRPVGEVSAGPAMPSAGAGRPAILGRHRTQKVELWKQAKCHLAAILERRGFGPCFAPPCVELRPRAQ
jgi:hypothetical protein